MPCCSVLLLSPSPFSLFFLYSSGLAGCRVHTAVAIVPVGEDLGGRVALGGIQVAEGHGPVVAGAVAGDLDNEFIRFSMRKGRNHRKFQLPLSRHPVVHQPGLSRGRAINPVAFEHGG